MRDAIPMRCFGCLLWLGGLGCGTDAPLQMHSPDLALAPGPAANNDSGVLRTDMALVTTDGGIPITTSTLKNAAGMNVEPGMRPWRYNGPQPDSWWCSDGVDCFVDPA